MILSIEAMPLSKLAVKMNMAKLTRGQEDRRLLNLNMRLTTTHIKISGIAKKSEMAGASTKKLSALNRSPESTSRPFIAINFSYIELIFDLRKHEKLTISRQTRRSSKL